MPQPRAVPEPPQQHDEIIGYRVWDLPVRLFHWTNVLCILALAGIGLVILNGKALGLSAEGKILLKTLHVQVGYVFAINLALRLLWAFVGPPSARWRAMLPCGAGYLRDLRRHLVAMATGARQAHLGHNPLGRLAIVALMIVLLSQAITGLILGGTDLYFPPFGSIIAGQVAAPGVDPATLVPNASELVDPVAYAAMREWRGPIVSLHLYAFYVLIGLVVLHVAGVVVAEVRERSGLVSAMFTGTKFIAGTPADAPTGRTAGDDRPEPPRGHG